MSALTERFSLTVIYKILMAEFLVGFVVWYAMADGLKDASGTVLGSDFLNVYAAGLLAKGGRPELIYDWTVHWAAEKYVTGYETSYFAWHYPPMFLAVATVAAMIPYLWAFAVYISATFAAYWLVLRRIMPETKEAFWMLAAFPGGFCNLINGQNGFLTAALLGGGLWTLEKRPWLAGCLFGLLSYKPQFFVAIPLLLAVGGYWRAFFAAGAMALGISAMSLLIWGSETWLAFINSLALTQHIIVERGATGFQKIQSVFALARIWHADIATAYAVQALATAGALLCAAWVWHRKPSPAVRAASLCAALILTTPYLLDYDLVVLAVPIAFWVREAAEKPLALPEKILLAALWLLPFIARHMATFYLPLTPPLMMILLFSCVERVQAASHSPRRRL